MRAQDAQYGARQALELGVLLRAQLPGAELEGDVDELDVAQPLAQRVAVAHLLERVGTLQVLDGRRIERLVEVVVARALVVDDVLLARDGDARRCQGDDGDAYRRTHADADRDVAPEAAVVDDVVLASVRSAPIAPDETPVGVDVGDHARAVGAGVDGRDDAVGPALGARIGPAPEALGLVVADDGAVVLLDDDAVARLLDDAAAAFLDALLAALLHLIEAARGCGRSWREGSARRG